MRDLKDAEEDAKSKCVYKRRNQNYDDNDSQDEENKDAPESQLDTTKGITMKNDDGTITELRSNPQFKNY